MNACGKSAFSYLVHEKITIDTEKMLHSKESKDTKNEN